MKSKKCEKCGKSFRSAYVSRTCRPCMRAAVAPYWAGSATASVVADYAAGNVRVVRAEG